MVGNIYLYGLIGDGFTDNMGLPVHGIKLVDVISQVQNQKQATSFNVHINSEGGFVKTGYDIYNYLKSLGKPINTIAEAKCMSIATVIFMAGQTRTVNPDTKFMIHTPWGASEGDADKIEEFAKNLRAIEKDVLAFYKTNTGLTQDAILPLLKEETYLTPKQTVELGFATNVSTVLKAVAIFNSNKDMGFLDNILNKAKGKDPVMLDTTLANGDIVKIETEATSPAVGDNVTNADGQPVPDGDHTDKDGNVLTTVAGVITDIKAKEDEGDAPDPDSADGDNAITAALNAALKPINDRLEAMEGQMKLNNETREAIEQVAGELGKMQLRHNTLAKSVKSTYKAPGKTEMKGIKQDGEEDLYEKVKAQRAARDEKNQD